MNRQIIATGYLLSSLLFPLKAEAASFFSDIYVFGDSISDTGRSFAATEGLAPPYADGGGRFSNGPIWVDYLAEQLQLTYDPSKNFAVGGATTGSFNTTQPLIPFPVPELVGLQQQVDSFLAANPVADPQALYLIWAGSNDYLGAGVQDPTIPVTNLTGEVTSLAGVGAENIVVFNLPSLGALPLVSGNPTAIANLNLLTDLHNSSLAASLADLDKLLGPEVEVTLVDVNSLFKQALEPDNPFGFTNTTAPCIDLNTLVRCDNPDERLFWDNIHVNTIAHGEIADEVFATVVPEPNATSSLLVMGGLGTVFLLRRKRQSENQQIPK